MLLIIYIILFVSPATSDCVIDNRNREETLEEKLHKDLQCNYFIPESPNPNGTVEISFGIMITSFKFTSQEEVFAANTMVYLTWQDVRLKWNASNYDGMNQTQMMSSRLWLPGIRLINVANQDDNDRYFFLPCKVKNTGKVECRPRYIFKARCSTKLANWPLDTQTCKLQFGAWKRQGTTVRFIMNKSFSYVRHQTVTWDVVKVKHEILSGSDVQSQLIMTLKREASPLSAIVIQPCVVLTFLTIACFFLDVRGELRLVTICFSLACHLYLLSSLSEYIPKHSIEPPTILFFYRGSVIVTMLGIILTLFLRVICKKRTIPPPWLTSVNEILSKVREKIAVWPKWACDVSDKYLQEWLDLANLVNVLYFLVSIVAYVYMFVAFIPKA